MGAESESGSAGRGLQALDGDRRDCWLCRRSVPECALFCPHCGAVLPGQSNDPFALFGLERRFDLDVESLTRHYATLQRMLTPERLAVKSTHERSVAQDVLSQLSVAYGVLRDPIRRATALLTLAGVPLSGPLTGLEPFVQQDDSDPVPATDRLPEDALNLQSLVESAGNGAALDQLAHRALHEMEACIHALSVAFRSSRLGEAQAILVRLELLESTSARIRSLRSGLPHPLPGSAPHTSG